MHGLNIAFWAPKHGIGVTSSVIASVACVAALENCDCVVTRAGGVSGDLERILVGRQRAEATAGVTGVDAVIADLRSGLYETQNSMLRAGEHILLLAGSSMEERLSAGHLCGKWDRGLSGRSDGIMDKIRYLLSERYMFTFTDAGTGEEAGASDALKAADLVVTVLDQNPGVIGDVMASDIVREKPCIFLLSDYDRESRFSLFNLKTLFGALKGSNTFALPHCTAFMDAVSRGRAVKFLEEGLATEGESGESDFFRSLIRLAEGMTKAAVGAAGRSGATMTAEEEELLPESDDYHEADREADCEADRKADRRAERRADRRAERRAERRADRKTVLGRAKASKAVRR